jgi:hypothetical protein
MMKRFFFILSIIFLTGAVFQISVAKIEKEDIAGFWLCDEGSGDTAKDSSGNGNNGKLNNVKWDKNGKFGGALSFTGSNNWVEVPANASLNLSEVTVLAWFKYIDAGDGWLAILANGTQNGPWENYGLFINRGGRYLYFCLSLGAEGQATCPQTSNNVIEPEKWTHTAASYDGNTARIYVNGEEKFKVDKGQKLVPGKQPLRIGHRNGSTHFYNGLMDEVAVFNRALKPDEIKQAMEGMGSLLAVQSSGKLTTTWGRIRSE